MAGLYGARCVGEEARLTCGSRRVKVAAVHIAVSLSGNTTGNQGARLACESVRALGHEMIRKDYFIEVCTYPAQLFHRLY
jgi:hypothetical protein